MNRLHFFKPLKHLWLGVAILIGWLLPQSASANNVVAGDVTTTLTPPGFFFDAAATGGGDFSMTAGTAANFDRSFGALNVGGGTLISIAGIGWASAGTPGTPTSFSVTITYLGANGVSGGGDDVVIGTVTDSTTLSTTASEWVWKFTTPITATIDGVNNVFRVAVTATGGTWKMKTTSGTAASAVKLSVAGTSTAVVTSNPLLRTWVGSVAGSANATWDAATLNWTNPGVAGAINFTNATQVVFNDALDPNTASTNITLSAARAPAAMLVNSTNYDYSFSGSAISGTNALTKLGSRALTLNMASDYTGGSTLTAGTVRLGADNALGAGSVSLGGAALSSASGATREITNALSIGASTTLGDAANNGTLTVSGSVNFGGAARDLTINSPVVLSGFQTNGGLGQKFGSGSLTYSNATGTASVGQWQIENGDLTINGGSLNKFSGGFRIGNTTAAGVTRVTLTNGAVLNFSGSGLNIRLGNDQAPAASATSTNILDVAGTLAWITNNSGFIFIGTAGQLAQLNLLSGGGLQIGGFTPGANASELNFNGGTLSPITNQAAFLQGLTRAFVRSGGANFDTVGFNITVGQALLDGSGGGGLSKAGLGALTLTNSSTYTGSTVVGNGTLALSGVASIANSANIVIAGGATFDVSALATSFALGAGQTLSNSTATALMGGNLGTGSGAVALTYASGTPSFNITNGTLTLSGSTTFTVNNTGSALAVGSYKIISKNTGGGVAGTLPAVTVNGGGLASGTSGSLQISSGELYLVVQNTTATALTLSAGSNPSTYGTALTLQAMVSPAPADGSTITFKDGATTIGTGTTVSGVATLTTNALAAGSHSLTTVYPGDASSLGSTSSALSQTVNPAPLGITANNDSKTYNGLGYTGGNGVTYSGFVNSETSAVLGGSLSYGGTSQNATNAGSYSIIPSGLTSANYAISYTNGLLTVIQANTFVGASSTKNPSGFTDSVSFTATLPADATGSVVFFSPSGSFSTNAVSGGNASSVALITLARGTNLITVAYLGDGNYSGSTNTLNQIVTNHPPVANNASYTRNAAVNSFKILVSNLLTNATDSDGDTLALVSVSATTNNATIAVASGYVMYNNTNAVADQFTYTVTDGNGGTNSATVNISIDNTPIFGQSQIVNTTGGTATLNFAGIPGYSYSVGRSADLSSWMVIWTTNAPVGGVFEFIDTSAPSTNAFYRLQFNP
jgi:autotransporter-associated beta strand protein